MQVTLFGFWMSVNVDRKQRLIPWHPHWQQLSPCLGCNYREIPKLHSNLWLINRCHGGQIIIGSKEKCILHNPSIIFSLKLGPELLPNAYEDGVAQLPAGALHHGRVVVLDEYGGGQQSQENPWWKGDSNILFFEVFVTKKIIIFRWRCKLLLREASCLHTKFFF